MSDITKNIADYIRGNRITLKTVLDKSGLSKNVIYRCLGNNPRRKLRVDEFFIICNALCLNPIDIVSNQNDTTGKEVS